MAKIAAKVMNLSIGGVALEGYTTEIEQSLTQETPDSTALSDDGPRVVPANYGWGSSFGGGADFASGASDATIFGDLADTGEAYVLQPTGNAAGASDPNYTGTVVLQSYTIRGSNGQIVTFNATYTGNSALTRAVA